MFILELKKVFRVGMIKRIARGRAIAFYFFLALEEEGFGGFEVETRVLQ